MRPHHPPVSPVVVGLQVGLQALFAFLLLFVVVMAFVRPSTAIWWIVAVAAVMAVTYVASLLTHTVAEPRRRRMWRLLWLGVLTLEWLLLVWLTPSASYLVFPLFFLYLDQLRDPWGPVAVAVAAIGSVLALAAHDGWTVGGVLGPSIGAVVAVVVGRAYAALRRDSEEHERLYRELLATQGRLAAAEREAGVLAERERLARDIHDTVAQSLSSIGLLLAAVERSDPGSPAAPQVRLARETAVASLAETRSLIRELTPPPLAEQSIAAALRRLSAGAWARPGLVIEVRAGDATRLPMPQQTALLRIAQGAMANVLGHASASTVRIELVVSTADVQLRIDDDGVGFDPASLDTRAPAAGTRGSFGLRAVRERAEQLGGSMSIDSAPGQGTRLRVALPLEAAP